MSRPTPLRLAGFALTALGGLLVGYGSLQTWVTTRVPAVRGGILDSVYPGTDLLDGKVTLGIGVAVLVGAVAVRLARSVAARRIVALGILVGGAAAAATGVVFLVRADSRFSGAEPGGAALPQVVERGAGADLVVAGGVSAAVGGLLALAWVARAAGEAEGATARSPTEEQANEEPAT